MGIKCTGSLVLALFAILGAAQREDLCKPSSGYDNFQRLNENDAEIGKEIFFLDIPGNASQVTLSSGYNEFIALNTTSRWVWINGTIDADTMERAQELTIVCREVDFPGSVELLVSILVMDYNDNKPNFTSDEYTLVIGEMTEVMTVIDAGISSTDADIDFLNRQITYAILPGPYSMTEVMTVIDAGISSTDADIDFLNRQITYAILPGPYSDYFTLGVLSQATLTLIKPLDFETLPRLNITLIAWFKKGSKRFGFLYIASPQQGDLRLSGCPSGQVAGGLARTRDRRVPVDLRADSLGHRERKTNGPTLNDTCFVDIIVEDEDDQNPLFNSSVYEAFIADTATLNSVVTIQPEIAAYDPDITLNATILYSFREAIYQREQFQTPIPETDVGQPFTSAQNSQSKELLTIDPFTAEVRLSSMPTSRETYLMLQATQEDNPSRYAVALLTLIVQGSNVNAPVFTRPSVQQSLVRSEAFPVGSVIATVLATDADRGSIIKYSLDEASKSSFSLNENTGDITLTSALSYQEKPQHILKVTASDGAFQTTGQVTIRVSPVNNKPPVILNSDLNVSIDRQTGASVIDIIAEDNDEGVTVLSYEILTHANLFAVDSQGRVTVSGKSEDLEQSEYQVAVLVSDNGQPSHSTAAVVKVSFPKQSPPLVGAQMAESDSLWPMILGAVAAVLLVIVIILAVYICRRRLRDKEHLDRAKKQQPSQDAKALAFKQQGTLGRQARANIEFGEDPLDGDTTIQENPLNSAAKGGYYNFGHVYSDTDTEVDMNEIHVETSVSPYDVLPARRNDDNNNDNVYNNSQMSEESEDYPTSEKEVITSFFRNGSLSTYRDSSGSEASLNTSPTDSHDSKKNLVAPTPLARSRVPEEEMTNGGHAVATVSDTANLDPDSSVVPSPQKQELTVYF
ncbi:protocadherin fat 4-like [Plakobranchus ocellatus]|uniref:Protocadherin fat 4-like n=1 Tax=Plakobranchus ocellatus TaxID=259542 RepID=A0AAV4CVI7_9GAST|nr:protocadherin fat 4-like [Plakobranchus ocellatus]